jgi:cellulose synthase/poly-beta-1,6-N-acetylglucosamine synthase-like glycosyltransferase
MSHALHLLPLVINWIALACLAVFGIHRYVMLVLFLRTRHAAPHPPRELSDRELPFVTVQLPLYNELHVATRLIDAVCALDYPRDRLEIQVLDDSTDRTTEVVADAIRRNRCGGARIVHLRRTRESGTRAGYKAGALAYGLARARGSVIAVLDADFLPPASFLRRTVPFLEDAEVGAVQVRWGHTNRRYSLLTRVQALLLDGHFLIEHTARSRTGRFFNFNGTCGVWRADAIRAAGGWHHDTLTEDLDLSYRAQLAGWKFVYLNDEVCPGELPGEMSAFQSQQFRWAKGSIQTGQKLLRRIWRTSLSLHIKLESTVHLLNNVVYLLMVVPVFLALPLVLTARPPDAAVQLSLYAIFFLLSSISVTIYYGMTASAAGLGATRGLLLVPPLMALGVGMTVNNGAAVLDALLHRPSEFIRTPKYSLGERPSRQEQRWYRPSGNSHVGIELVLGLYLLVSLWATVERGYYIAAPILGLFATGFFWVAGAAILDRRERRVHVPRQEPAVRLGT